MLDPHVGDVERTPKKSLATSPARRRPSKTAGRCQTSLDARRYIHRVDACFGLGLARVFFLHLFVAGL